MMAHVLLVAHLLLLSTACGWGAPNKRFARGLKAVSNTSRFQKPYNICTSDWAPIVTCTEGEDPATFGGFQIALWREIAEDLGWEDSDWTLSCMDWTAMIDDLADPSGLCSFAAAGVEVSMPNILLGLKFSWPIYKSGFHVLIASHVEAGGTWAFAAAFDWTVWVVLGATAVVVSLLVTVVEVFTYGNRANRKGWRGWSWYSMGKMVQVPTHVGDPKTWASRLLVLGYAFLVLIIVHLFTATTASKMTMQRLANDITSKADLPGKAVESWEPYVPLLRKYSIDAAPLAWDNDDDTKVMLDNLRSNRYQALILDSPVVQYFAAQAEHCDLYPVGDPFETFNLAIAFPPNTPDELPANVSASIVRLQTTSAVLDVLENKYIKTVEKADGSSGCGNAYQDSGSHGSATDPQIHINQVAGLWYILLITLGMAFPVTLLQHARHYKKVKAKLISSFSGKCSQHRQAAQAALQDEDCIAEVNAPSTSQGKPGNVVPPVAGEHTAAATAAVEGSPNSSWGRDKGQPRGLAALAAAGVTPVTAFVSPTAQMPGQVPGLE